ncbi:9690_t:CDS:2 [Ambispora leptoticha]|uniref:Glutamate pyruvate transaminase n=1 Tax=Ambispora leptoticha TaxID=144679 RepID=A0A9N8W0Y3_9GLOM|nr:9690_t:CDS:2 [Ambispora leptoticha]
MSLKKTSHHPTLNLQIFFIMRPRINQVAGNHPFLNVTATKNNKNYSKKLYYKLFTSSPHYSFSSSYSPYSISNSFTHSPRQRQISSPSRVGSIYKSSIISSNNNIITSITKSTNIYSRFNLSSSLPLKIMFHYSASSSEGGSAVVNGGGLDKKEQKLGKILTVDNINPHVKKVEYAVRGELAIRADNISREILEPHNKYAFKNIVHCNIGNPQQLNQKPITFFRQVASLTQYPDLLLPENRSKIEALYPRDAIERAEKLLKHIGSVGAYSHSQGISHIRENVAKFIEERDGYPSDPNLIFLTHGASSGVQSMLQLIIEHPNVGIMIPIPQYPLYSATISLFNAKAVPYYLDEEQEWSLDIKGLYSSISKARENGIDVRALVIINPGNPTGQCLPLENMREVIDFCHKERILLIADEVYQTNIYQPETRPFHSFKKVLRSMGDAYKDFELVSFHSISKGMIGECGQRGGYLELTGMDPKVVEQLYKIASVSLCPNVTGQIMIDLMVRPPKRGEESYEQYIKEITAIYESLKRRSRKLAECFNELEGVTCNNAQGSMYLFPTIRLPKKLIKAAHVAKKQPDEFYCLAMLEATGVCVVPGSGFGQKSSTWHFRISRLIN